MKLKPSILGLVMGSVIFLVFTIAFILCHNDKGYSGATVINDETYYFFSLHDISCAELPDEHNMLLLNYGMDHVIFEEIDVKNNKIFFCGDNVFLDKNENCIYAQPYFIITKNGTFIQRERFHLNSYEPSNGIVKLDYNDFAKYLKVYTIKGLTDSNIIIAVLYGNDLHDYYETTFYTIKNDKLIWIYSLIDDDSFADGCSIAMRLSGDFITEDNCIIDKTKGLKFIFDLNNCGVKYYKIN